MKVQLQLKTSQHLALTPQLQQSISLLQLSTVELEQELETYLRQNPLLERVEEASTDGHVGPGMAPAETPIPQEMENPPDSPWSDLDSAVPEWRADTIDPPELYVERETTLIEHLSQQLRLINLSERDEELVTLLISNLDEAGYLQVSLEETQAAIPPEKAIELDDLGVALKLLQSLDPTGIGARNLAECLTLQLDAQPRDELVWRSAKRLVARHLDLLASRDHARLKRVLGVDDGELKQICRIVTQLDPKPGLKYLPEETRYVAPDVIVRKSGRQWVVSLNREALPKLKINAYYAQMLKEGDASGGLAQQLQEARWLVRNIQQRCDTILRVARAIVNQQQGFLEHGEVAMRPLVLREIAEELELHESTISRVTTQKYLMTPRGLYELKYFFSSHVDTDNGGAASSTAIRALIRQFVAAEDIKKPLSDHRISAMLAEQGIPVARRTVAKYREAMQIHPASQRKSL